MADLFRRQAVDFQRQQFHGAIVLVRSPWRTAIAALFVLLVLALLAFAATQGFARKETVAGVVAPAGGVLRLVAPQAGVVAAVVAAQGTRVAAGQAVVRLSAEQATANGSAQAAVAESLVARQGSLRDELRQQSQQGLQQAQALDARAARAEAALAQQEREIALQRERVQLVRDIAARYPDLVRSGAVSPVESAQKQDELLDQQSRLAEMERARVGLQGELGTLRAERAALPLQSGREAAQLQRQMQALTQAQVENETRRGTQVLAPAAGQLAAVLAAPGQAVETGQVLATLLPAGAALEAELWVPTRAAAFVHVGTPVWLRVDAFPYERYGQLSAHVSEVAQSALPVAALAPGADAYRVRVALDADAPGQPQPAWRDALRPGMRVQASLVGERRTLLQWALEPLAALRVATR